MTLAIKVFGIGLAGVTTVGAGTASYLLLSPKTIVLATTEDYQKHCYTLTKFTKDNSDGSNFQLLACQSNTKTDDVSFYLYKRGSKGVSNSNDSFEEVKSVGVTSSSSSVTVNLLKGDSENNGNQLNIDGVGWKPNEQLNNLTLKDVCKLNWWASGDWERKLTCQVNGQEVESKITKWEKFN